MPPQGAARDEMLKIMARLFTSPFVTIVSHDVKRDYLLLKREGIAFTAPYYDTSVAHYLIEPEMNHSFPRVVAAYLDYHTRLR